MTKQHDIYSVLKWNLQILKKHGGIMGYKGYHENMMGIYWGYNAISLIFITPFLWSQMCVLFLFFLTIIISYLFGDGITMQQFCSVAKFWERRIKAIESGHSQNGERENHSILSHGRQESRKLSTNPMKFDVFRDEASTRSWRSRGSPRSRSRKVSAEDFKIHLNHLSRTTLW